MDTEHEVEFEYYEPRFWGLDPVFSTRVKLNIVDVMSLQPHPTVPEVYCILNHPVQSVHIMGDVVSLQKKSRMMKFEVDDGTGVICCTQWYLEEDSERGLFIPKLGQLVAVWGKLSEYRHQKQLTVTTIVEQVDPNAEPLHWLEVAYLKKTVYGRPFSLPPEVSAGSQLEESLKDNIEEAVLEFLKETSGRHFTLAQLCTEPDLFRRCMARSACKEQVVAAMSSTIHKLPDVGVVIPALGTGKQKETKYELFSPKQHLCPIILKYIQRKESTTESAARLGVPEDWIVEFVNQKEIFHKLPTAAILEAIELLVGDSQVYLYGTKSYRTIT